MKRSVPDAEDASCPLDLDALGMIAKRLDFETLANFRLVCASFKLSVLKLGENFFHRRFVEANSFRHLRSIPMPRAAYSPLASSSSGKMLEVERCSLHTTDGGFHVVKATPRPYRCIFVRWDETGDAPWICNKRDKMQIHQGTFDYRVENSMIYRSDGKTLKIGPNLPLWHLEGRFAFFQRFKGHATIADLDSMSLSSDFGFGKTFFHRGCGFAVEDVYHKIYCETDEVDDNGSFDNEYSFELDHYSDDEDDEDYIGVIRERHRIVRIGSDGSKVVYDHGDGLREMSEGEISVALAFVDSKGLLTIVISSYDSKIGKVPFEGGKIEWKFLADSKICSCARFGDEVVAFYSSDGEGSLARTVAGRDLPFVQEFDETDVREKMICDLSEKKMALVDVNGRVSVYELGD